MDAQTNLDSIKALSEKTGIEMLVIDEAQKITATNATRFLRRFIISLYSNDPIHSKIKQDYPKHKTVELPGISFLVDHDISERLVDALNKKFSYRQCLAFISDDNIEDDKRKTISLIQTFDKYNILRLQETSGGSYLFSTDSLIEKLKCFEKKYPFKFIGVGNDWVTIQTVDIPENWIDFATEVLNVCPVDDMVSNIDLNKYSNELKKDNGRVFMWWD